jgi:peptidoglycan/LPS O-acetylase OafA/YrhL
LGLVVFLSAIALIHLAVTSPNGDIVGGWSLSPEQLRIGITRLIYPYTAGMLLRRLVKPGSGKSTFLLTSLMLVGVLSVPRIGGYDYLWANGLYDSLTVIFIFPLIMHLGASGQVKSRFAGKVCTFLGDISYPIYIIHFPFVYIFYAWVINNDIPLGQGILVGAGILTGSIILSVAALRLYDEPVRKWLARRFLNKNLKKESRVRT